MEDLKSETYWEDLLKRGTTRFFLLAALAQRPRHGYALAQWLQEKWGHCCGVSYAMIYPTLRELLEGGYVNCWEETQGSRTRKVCGLTPKGVEAYQAAAKVWAAVLPSLGEAVGDASGPCCPLPMPATPAMKPSTEVPPWTSSAEPR